jgi:hypothetical protein
MTDVADLYKGLTGLGDGSAERYRQMRRRLKRLQISEVSSVDRGAGYGCDVVLIKRDDEQERAMKHDPHAELDGIVSDLQDGKIGRNVGFSRLKSWHDKHAFFRDRRDPRGRPLSDAQQFQDFLEGTPQGRIANQAMLNGLESTHEELQAEATKAAGRKPIMHLADNSEIADAVDRANPDPRVGKAELIQKAADSISACVAEFAKPNENYGVTFDRLFRDEPAFRSLIALDKRLRNVA